MKKNFSGFTIIELLIVIVIVGVLATLGLASFSGPREQAMEKEALGNLKLMAASERMYRMENTGYISCANTSVVNTNLRLLIPSNDPYWAYKVDVVGAAFSAKAQRVNNLTKVFCINDTQDTPQLSGCSW